MKKSIKKLAVLACLCGTAYQLGVLVQKDEVQDKLFALLGEDTYLKAEAMTRTASDLLQWPVHFVKALLP